MPTSVANHYRPQTMAAGVGCRPPRRHANAGRPAVCKMGATFCNACMVAMAIVD